MPVYIQHLATALPKTAYNQTFLRDHMLRQFEGRRRAQNLVRRVYDASGITTRHSVVDDLAGGRSPLLFCPEQGALRPGTAERNAVYVGASRRLAAAAGRSLLAGSAFGSADITHVITVSCTGFYAPDPGYALVRDLELSPQTHRYNIGFMGCFAAFQGLQLAQAICRADASATVMLVCVEICTIHLHLDDQPDNIVSASVFADGAGAALVSARRGADARYRLDGFATALSENGEEHMTWTIGDHGFDMVLSRYVPGVLATNLPRALEPLKDLIGDGDIRHWAVHPGGRAILDKVESGLDLHPSCLAASRQVLADFGNMSSATVLFVLRELLRTPAAADESVIAMAFGPGITIESAALTRLAG